MPEIKRSNPLHRSIASAYRANRRLGILFNRVGSRDKPRGHVFASYRQARRATRSINLSGGVMAVPQLRDVFYTLREDLRRGAHELAGQALEISEQNARAQATAFDIEHEDYRFPDLIDQIETGEAAILAGTSRQEALAISFAVAEVEEAMIVGDDRHEGMFNPVVVAGDERDWLSELIAAGYVEFFGALGAGGRLPPNLWKVAIAVIDLRTTDTCAEVNGQTQPLDQPFYLVAEPRYADEMDGPPFHKNCRTMMSLYIETLDDGIVSEMRAESREILA